MVFLYIILFFILIIILSGIGIIGGILRILFGGAKKATQHRQPGEKSSTSWYTYNRKHKKVFDKNDGEYVDFEEIKDENDKK